MPPDLAKMITAFMNAHSRASSHWPWRSSRCLPSVRSVLDVGGGSGIFAIELAKALASAQRHGAGDRHDLRGSRPATSPRPAWRIA